MEIVKRYPSVSPFDVRREKAREVFLLIKRLNNYIRYQGEVDDNGNRLKKGETIIEKNGKRILMRPAGDNWF